MEIYEMKYILTMAEEKSVSKAAEKLFISQPSLSQILKKLEKRIGHDLFVRSATGLQLTHAGEKLVRLAREMLNLKSELDLIMRDIASSTAGRLTIGIPTFWGSYILPMLLTDFHRIYPNVQVIIKNATSSCLEGMLLKDEIDLAIMTLPIISNEIKYIILFNEELLLAVSPENPLAKMGVDAEGEEYPYLDPRKLHDQTFIIFPPGTRLRETSDTFFSTYGFEPKVITYATGIDTVKRLVACNVGVSFLPASFAKSFTSPPNPRYFFLGKTTLPRWTLVVASKKKGYCTKLIKDFIDAAERLFASVK